MTQEARLTVLGARGSIPVSGKEYVRYGGATTCYRLEYDDCTVILDGGTGIIRHRQQESGKPCHILITHPHADHLYGLPMLKLLYSQDFSVFIHGADYSGKTVKEQLECLMCPPLWPITSEVFRAKTEFCSFKVGDTLSLSSTVSAETLSVNHPGGCIAYKLSFGGKNLVFATDVELSEDMTEKLSGFAAGCDLLVLDAQYTKEEYKARMGFGHPSIDQSLRLIEKCVPKVALLTHHDPFRTDDELDEIAASLPKNVQLAKEGMEVTL